MHLHGLDERDAELCAARQQTMISGKRLVRSIVAMQCCGHAYTKACFRGCCTDAQGGVNSNIDPADRAAASRDSRSGKERCGSLWSSVFEHSILRRAVCLAAHGSVV